MGILDKLGPLCLAFGIVVVLAGLVKKLGQWRRPSVRTGDSPLAKDAELLPGLLTRHQAMEGVLGIGGTGSGKSSTLGWLMRAMMERGFGMLILTAKVSDFDGILRIARKTGREQDLVRFAPDEPWRLDFLNHELSSPGGSVATASQLMQDLVDFSTRTQTQNSNEPFWPIAAARKIRMAMTVTLAAKGHCGIEDVYRFCTSMANTPQERESAEFHQSFCGQCLHEAAAKAPDDPDVNLAASYVLGEWCRLSDRTGGCIDAYVNNLTEKFMHGSVRELVASGRTNVSPRDIVHQRKIIVTDTPVLKYREPGQFIQMVWKLQTQREVLRRRVTRESIPVCIWADEAQLHALPSVDSMVTAVGRSQLLVQCGITQNLPLLISTLKNREDAIAWLSNLQTKFIFANSDMETSEWASKLLGSSKHMFMGGSTSQGEYDAWGDMWSGESGAKVTGSFNEHWHPDVPPEVFASEKMRKGGVENEFIVDFYLHRTGARFPQNGGKAWLKVAMKQHI